MMDSNGFHRTLEVKGRPAETSRFWVHFTPTPVSWLNLVKVWFSNIERQAVHRAHVALVPELN
jgi:hypothetical protein